MTLHGRGRSPCLPNHAHRSTASSPIPPKKNRNLHHSRYTHPMKTKSQIAIALIIASQFFSPLTTAQAPSLRIAEGPIVLHANMDQQWGGHTFSYLLEGEHAIFWSATAYNADGKTWGSLIGQYPKPGSNAEPATTSLPMPGIDVKSMTQPLMLRSPDGYIHIIIGFSRDTGDPTYAPGGLRYFRSAEPEDISQLVDRSELIPRMAPFNEFHLRMNAGISRDGRRAAIVILAISKDGSVPFNTPVIFLADKQGSDFVFREPIRYAEPMGFFYPQIALTDSGTVVVGQLWDNAARSITRIMQLDDSGKITHREDIPVTADGNYWCCDLRPIAPDNWNDLVLYYNKYPKDKQDCRHEFWTYTPSTTTLKQHRSIPVPEGQINYGKWIPISKDRSAFIHNPSMGSFEAYDGNLLGEGDFTTIPLPATDPVMHGYVGTAYTFVPNPLQGSYTTPGSTWFATDFIPNKNDPNERTRATFLLYRLAFTN
jgi:hypothetical protein